MNQAGMSKQHVTRQNANEYAMKVDTAIELVDLDLDEKLKDRLPAKMKIDNSKINVEKLEKFWKSWTLLEKIEFSKRFGDIYGLTKINVDWTMIKGLMHFWDPEYRCFTFNRMDLTPTVEEYIQMLKLPAESNIYSSYIIRKDSNLKRQLGSILNLPAEKVNIREVVKTDKQGKAVKCRGISLNALLQHVQRLSVEPRDKRYKQNAFALAIYGVLIFPYQHEFIEENVVYLFFDVLSHNVNPVYAILAETFMSLNYCRRTGVGGKLRCCVPLLHVWAISHFVHKSKEKFSLYYERTKGPVLTEASHVPSPNYKIDEWVNYLLELGPKTVIWIPKWMVLGNILYACGTFHWVPLMGPWSGISYAPSLVLRQFGFKQHIPHLKELNQWEFTSKSSNIQDYMNQLQEAWYNPRIAERPICGKLVVDDYACWHRSRIRGFPYPTKAVPLPASSSTPSKPSKPSQEEWDEMWAKQGELFNLIATEYKAAIHRKDALLHGHARMSLAIEQVSEKAKRIEPEIDALAKRVEDLESKNLRFKENLADIQSNKV